MTVFTNLKDLPTLLEMLKPLIQFAGHFIYVVVKSKFDILRREGSLKT